MNAGFSAPAKIILFGEHAVVYGLPAIAIPLSNLRARATVEANLPAFSGLRIVAEDLDHVIEFAQSEDDDPLTVMVRLIIDHLNLEAPNVTIHLHSQIPVASGLGSGAAIAAVLGRAISAATQHPLSLEQLNNLVYEIEKYHHGTPSGIDNTVVVYEKPVYFRRGHALEQLIIKEPFHIIIADTGQRAPTKVAVGDVRKLYDRNPTQMQQTLDKIGAIAQQARHCIETGNITALGMLMNDNHAQLQKLTVSSPELDYLVQAAVNAGALGAKLSGGGRGGNLISLVMPDTADAVKAALLTAGAARVFETTVNP